MRFSEITEEEFSQFSMLYENANFWQSTSMAHLREWNGWKYVYVGIKDNDTLIAATMLSYRTVFLKSTFVQAVRGFYIDYHNKELLSFFHKHLVSYLKGMNCMYFKIDPYICYKERDMFGNLVQDGFDNSDIVDNLKELGYKHSGFLIGNDNSREPNWMFVSTIKNKTEDQLLKDFDHQTRWSINKTLKIGIKIKEATIEDLPTFKEIMEHTADRRGFIDHNLHYYKGLFHTFGKDSLLRILIAQLDLNEYEKNLLEEKTAAQQELFEIEKVLEETPNSKKYRKKHKVVEEQIELVVRKLEECERLLKKSGKDHLDLAAGTFISVGKEVMYLYSGAYEEYMKFNGPYAIHWHMLRIALKEGRERYNFYGISGDFDKQAEDYGIYDFKKGFSGTVEELIGDFYLYLQPNTYRLYQMLRRIKNRIKK